MGDAADPREMKRTFIVPAIKPFDHYDFSRAKIACNLAWLVAKAFGTGKWCRLFLFLPMLSTSRFLFLIPAPSLMCIFRYRFREMTGDEH